ncbi:hypothetical protein [Geodermatophilus sp. SYSU D00815]
MGHPLSTRTAARTAVVGVYVVVLAVAGRPGWLAALLVVLLAAVWAAPFLLATNRRPSSRAAGGREAPARGVSRPSR